ncbi:MAG: hypothetical protein HWE27_09240 [Gammaproteobacteria bacterium]|nr:hypothetical protein [Gammaproteobacteria bacterium]
MDSSDQAKTKFAVDESITLRYKIVNLTKRTQKIGFSSSQRIRAVIVNEKDEVTHDLDSSLMYMMALSEVKINSSDSQHFSVLMSSLGLSRGSYQIRAALALKDISSQMLIEQHTGQFYVSCSFQIE